MKNEKSFLMLGRICPKFLKNFDKQFLLINYTYFCEDLRLNFSPHSHFPRNTIRNENMTILTVSKKPNIIKTLQIVTFSITRYIFQNELDFNVFSASYESNLYFPIMTIKCPRIIAIKNIHGMRSCEDTRYQHLRQLYCFITKI